MLVSEGPIQKEFGFLCIPYVPGVGERNMNCFRPGTTSFAYASLKFRDLRENANREKGVISHDDRPSLYIDIFKSIWSLRLGQLYHYNPLIREITSNQINIHIGMALPSYIQISAY